MLCIGTKISPNLISPTARVAHQEVVGGALEWTRHARISGTVFARARSSARSISGGVEKQWRHKKSSVAFVATTFTSTAWQPRVKTCACKNFIVTKFSLGKIIRQKNFRPRRAWAKKAKFFSRRKFPAIRYIPKLIPANMYPIYSNASHGYY